MQGVLVSVASVAVTLSSGYVAYFNGATKVVGALTVTTTIEATAVEAGTLSGNVLRSTDGTSTVVNGVIEAQTLSGGKLSVVKASAGTGTLVVDGSTGGRFCLRDKGGTNWSVYQSLAGTLSGRAAQSGECP